LAIHILLRNNGAVELCSYKDSNVVVCNSCNVLWFTRFYWLNILETIYLDPEAEIPCKGIYCTFSRSANYYPPPPYLIAQYKRKYISKDKLVERIGIEII
jgi:hypothetical protein